MARAKTTEEAAQTNGIDTFKQAMIDVGMKLCDDVLQGRDRSPVSTLEAICNLYNAVK